MSKVKCEIRNLILSRSRQSNLESANKKLLNASFIETLGWKNEKDFWQNKIIPILNSRYSRDINENGNYIDRTWEIDLPFQIIFLLDILIKVNIILKIIAAPIPQNIIFFLISSLN